MTENPLFNLVLSFHSPYDGQSRERATRSIQKEAQVKGEVKEIQNQGEVGADRRGQKEAQDQRQVKKSKPKKHSSKRTGLKQAEDLPSDAAPNQHVLKGESNGKAMIDKSAEQSQVVPKSKHESTTESQPSKVLHSSLVKIAEYVQLAHEAAGRTALTAHTQHLRKSINSGISIALSEVQTSGTLQPEQAIKQKLRDKVLKCIDDKSRYTTSRQVLVTLNNFIQSLQVRVTAAQQSEDQDKNNKGQVQETHMDCGLGPGQMHRTRAHDRQGQWRKKTTFSKDVILVIWRRCILVHLRAMTKDEFLGVVESSFRMLSPQVDSSRALSWLSHATITDSGNVEVSIHTKDSKELETVTEDVITAWAEILQDKVEQSNRVFEVWYRTF